MGAVGRCAAVTANAHGGCATDEHALDVMAGPGSDTVAELIKE